MNTPQDTSEPLAAAGVLDHFATAKHARMAKLYGLTHYKGHDRPDCEGWWWAKSKLGWTVVKVREAGGRMWALDPYCGCEFDLNFPNDAHWDGVTEWAGPFEQPSDQWSNVKDQATASDADSQHEGHDTSGCLQPFCSPLPPPTSE